MSKTLTEKPKTSNKKRQKKSEKMTSVSEEPAILSGRAEPLLAPPTNSSATNQRAATARDAGTTCQSNTAA